MTKELMDKINDIGKNLFVYTMNGKEITEKQFYDEVKKMCRKCNKCKKGKII